MAWSEYSLTHRLAWFVFKKLACRSSFAFLTTNPSGTMGLRIPMDARQAFFSTRTSQLRGYPGLWTPSEDVGILSQDPCACTHTAHHTLAPTTLPHSVLGRSGCVCSSRCSCVSQCTPSFYVVMPMSAGPTFVLVVLVLVTALSSHSCLNLWLALVTPLDRATHIAGAALDLVFVSRDVAHANLLVHQGDSCCALSPSFLLSSSRVRPSLVCTFCPLAPLSRPPLPRQEPSWKTGVQFLSLPKSLWYIGSAWCNSAS